MGSENEITQNVEDIFKYNWFLFCQALHGSIYLSQYTIKMDYIKDPWATSSELEF